MPRNGSGIYNPPTNTWNPAVNGVTATAADWQALLLDMVAALTGSVSADGQTPMTGNLNMGNNRITQVAGATGIDDVASANDVQSGRLLYLTSISGTNTIIGNVMGLTAYTAGSSFRFVAAGQNTGATTLNINGLGAKDVTKAGALPLVGGEILSGGTYEVIYDGTRFQLVGAAARVIPAARNSDTILAGADFGREIVATTTFTQTLTAAATLGAGWYCQYRNNGTGIITLDPNGSETIDGATTLRLYPGEGCTIICDGSNFTTVGRSTGLVLIQSQTASGVASVDFTTGINSDFQKIVLEISDYVPATSGTQLRALVALGGVFQTAAAYVYGWNFVDESSVAFAFGTSGGAESSLYLMNNITNASGDGVSGRLELYNPAGTSSRKRILWDVCKLSSSDVVRGTGTGSYVNNNAAIDGIRLLPSSGNIASGTFKLYGVRA
jgi:hypothetical protein